MSAIADQPMLLFDADLIRRGAVFSSCRWWRYSLTRVWDEAKARICFVMLNPSTADADHDDATTRRCMRRVMKLGYGQYEAVNLFALRATKPTVLKAALHPIGPANDAAILSAAQRADRVVIAWGAHGSWHGRNIEALALLRALDLWCLGVTDGGQPRHPLYVPQRARMYQYRSARR